MTIGQRIKVRRTELGLSIDDLASKLGKNRTTIYRYENGDIENLPLCILDSLAESLDTTPAYLMGWEEMSNGNNGTKVKHIAAWYKEFEEYNLTDEEHDKIMEYTRFLLSQRG